MAQERFMITVVTPFKRKENLEFLSKLLQGKANWTVLVDDDDDTVFPEWVTVKKYEKPRDGVAKSNVLFNQFIRDGLDTETQYMILCDDDSVEDDFFDKIPNDDVVMVSMKRGDRPVRHVVWDDWENKLGHWENSIDNLIADPSNLKICRVGGEQLIAKGKVLRNFRYGLSNVGDGQMILKVAEEYKITYLPDVFVLFNYLEKGRYLKDFIYDKSKRAKPLALFIGDYWCAGNPRMGLSEWEGNIANSLHTSGLADVLCFHFDKYYYTTGVRGDQALVERIEYVNPDFIVMVVYKRLGQDATVIHEDTLKLINVFGIPIVTVWGDLEAQEQRDIAKIVAPYATISVGTANKDAVESVGFNYMHVPKDVTIWNNPKLLRDIDVLFYGSYGLGREERQHYLQYLLDNGIKLICGGSEGRDHFTTEDYAMGYKRAKIAISFSKAHGMNVVNARPFEAMSCGALLFEQKSDELAKLYTPGVDYVEWTTEVDLLEKVRYYLAHEDERTLIATNGQKKTEELYSAKTFWSKIISNLNANAK